MDSQGASPVKTYFTKFSQKDFLARIKQIEALPVADIAEPVVDIDAHRINKVESGLCLGICIYFLEVGLNVTTFCTNVQAKAEINKIIGYNSIYSAFPRVKTTQNAWGVERESDAEKIASILCCRSFNIVLTSDACSFSKLHSIIESLKQHVFFILCVSKARETHHVLVVRTEKLVALFDPNNGFFMQRNSSSECVAFLDKQLKNLFGHGEPPYHYSIVASKVSYEVSEEMFILKEDS